MFSNARKFQLLLQNNFLDTLELFKCGFFVRYLLLNIGIFNTFSLVARRCSGIADNTISLQKDPSQTICRAVSGRSLGFVVYKALLFPL